MQLYNNPLPDTWQKLLKRPVIDTSSLQLTVSQILSAVKLNGDQAVKAYTLEFDKTVIADMQVSDAEMEEAILNIPDQLKSAIGMAADNIRLFHASQQIIEPVVEVLPGVKCWRKSVAIEKVGLYIPGGSAPLFSTILMLGIPAQLAGCKEIILCSPPDPFGKLHPAIIFAARLVGINKIFKVGGVQAIAAMAYGTETIPAVYKIFGPGNQYVTCAKQLIQQEGIAIDMPAGPSEVCILADNTANPAFVAADLLSQAEHGTDSQVLLVTTDEKIVQTVQGEVELQLRSLPRKKIAEAALKNSIIVVMKEMDKAIDFINAYAPEHLIIVCENDTVIAEAIVNAGSIFIGNYSPESAGDYASGTNHTLPTNGAAKAYSGVSVDSFVKKITYQQLTLEGLAAIGPSIEAMADAEGLWAHKNAVSIRLKN